MNKSQYQEYLKTEHWLDVKKRFRASKLCKKRCYVCGGRSNIHIHHKSYKRIGNERLWDLIELCATCHKSVHKYLQKHKHRNTINLWVAAKKVKQRSSKSRRNQNKSNKKRKKTDNGCREGQAIHGALRRRREGRVMVHKFHANNLDCNEFCRAWGCHFPTKLFSHLLDHPQAVFGISRVGVWGS